MPRAKPATYVTDLTHFDGVLDPPSTAPTPAKRLAAFLTEVVRIATRERLGAICTDVRCFKKPGRRPCPGKIVTTRTRSEAAIGWEYPACGTNGVLHHWRGSVADLTKYAPIEVEAEHSEAAVPFNGSWRISDMQLWDTEVIELLGPGSFTFGDDRSGKFQFIAVRGWRDDESSEASGRGWAIVEDNGTLSGQIFFHQAGDSAFTAKRSPVGSRRAS
jgi:hypothetical protein